MLISANLLLQSNGGYSFGSTNSAFVNSVSIGSNNYTSDESESLGFYNSATYNSFSIGKGNNTRYCAYTYGQNNNAENMGIAIGQACTAKNGSVAIGLASNVDKCSFSLGKEITVTSGSLAMGETITAQKGAVAHGRSITAIDGSVGIGDNILSLSGSLVIGNNNMANKGDQVFGIGNTSYTGSTVIGFNNTACYATVVGNDNSINLAGGSSYPETYTKPAIPYVRPPEDIQIKSFVAGLGNNALYAKNTYILGHYNTITNRTEYANADNDGFTFIYGMRNSADRNWDMAIGYKSIASGGENIAIGVPFQTITGYYNGEGILYPAPGITNTLAKGYKNFALRGNVTGISNTAINSNLTGEYIGDELGHVTANKLINSFVSATTKVTNNGVDYYGYMLNNIIENSNALLTGQYINDNQLTNVANTQVSAESFSFNKFYHTEKVNLTGYRI